MENLTTLRHALHETEERLLTRLRSVRRDLRRTQGQTDQEPAHAPAPAPKLTLGQRVADIVAASMGSWNFINHPVDHSVDLDRPQRHRSVRRAVGPLPSSSCSISRCRFRPLTPRRSLMMSQNRQQDIDRQAAEHDHQIPASRPRKLEIELPCVELDQLARDRRSCISHPSSEELTGAVELRQDRGPDPVPQSADPIRHERSVI